MDAGVLHGIDGTTLVRQTVVEKYTNILRHGQSRVSTARFVLPPEFRLGPRKIHWNNNIKIKTRLLSQKRDHIYYNIICLYGWAYILY